MIRYKIVLLPFPFDDLSTNKVKPAVCLTDQIGDHGHVIVAFITSKIPSDLLASDLVINPDHPEFLSCGLRVASTVRLHRLMTVNSGLIQRELGMLPPSLQEETRKRLAGLFSLL